jgi:hypothetical protein
MKLHLKENLLNGCLIAAVCLLAAPNIHASADPFLDGQMTIVESEIKHWQGMSYLLGGLTLVVFVCGVVVGLLQAGTTRAKKITAGALAFASAVIVAATHTFFQADDRAYDKVAQQARMKLDDFAYNLNLFSTLDDDTKAGMRKQFGDIKKEINELEYSTLHNAAPISNRPRSQSSILIPAAWAEPATDMSHAPAWAKNLPTDNYNLYYVGTATGDTFRAAQENALANARTSLADAISKEAANSARLVSKTDVIEELGKALTGSAEIAETFVAPNPAGGFRGYVLLRLSRSAAVFTARSIFVKHGVSYDNRFLQTIIKDAP